MEKKYVIGIDYGTLSGRTALIALEDGSEAASSVMEYAHGVMDSQLPCGVKLEADFALQDPADYMEVLEKTVGDVMRQCGVRPQDVVGIGIDFTSSTVLPVYEDGTPLCYLEKYKSEPHAYAKLWKHHAARQQADMIDEKAQNEPWMKRYGNQVSAEWMLPKIVEILEKREDIYDEADYFVEAGDWIVWQLTGQKKRNLCMAGYKNFWNSEDGYPSKQFYRSIDERIENITETKLSGEVIPMGSKAGNLTREMAERLGLTEDTVVSASIVDAHGALPALGLIEPGKMLMIMGTSACYITLGEKECFVPGISGVVKDGIIPGYYAYEAGQSAMGDIFGWFVNNCVPKAYYDESEAQKVNIHQLLQKKAEGLPPGSNGLLALDWWNGNRSILSNTDLSGTIFGLTLSTAPEEIYRALLESTVYGARVILDAYREHGVEIRELYASGGIPAKNRLMMQICADVLNMPIKAAANPPSSALGSAVFAAAASGYFGSIEEAVDRMVDTEMICYVPNPENVKRYETIFGLYKEMHDYFGIENVGFMRRLKEV